MGCVAKCLVEVEGVGVGCLIGWLRLLCFCLIRWLGLDEMTRFLNVF